MRPLALTPRGEAISVLCLGAHSDDIEIGAGGTLLSWMDRGLRLDVHWCVLSAPEERAGEARSSADAFLRGAARSHVDVASFRDGFFPYQGDQIKEWFEGLKRRVTPDVIFTHRGGDAHQDHRLLQELTWNCFRDHLILEYEIPKWDGDLGHPNLYVPLTAGALESKIGLLEEHFGTQRSKDWFDADTFRGLARLRGMECRAESRFAEAFVCRKACIL
jgi:LmbE family N-acetylglucosaminyl deacetylase